MRYLICVLVLVSFGFAKDRQWEEAKVVKVTTSDMGTNSFILPLGSGLYGGTRNMSQSFYWLRTEKYTYAIPIQFIGHWGYPPLPLTVGGSARISVDNSKQMHIIDDDGKTRKVRIAARQVTQPAEEGHQ